MQTDKLQMEKKQILSPTENFYSFYRYVFLAVCERGDLIGS